MKTLTNSHRKYAPVLIMAILTMAAARWHCAAGTLLVYNNNDSGAGSLRQAIANNHVLGGGNSIVFSNVVSGTITLTSGELLISDNVTILGPGPSVLTVDGNYPHTTNRIFHIQPNLTVAISGLSIVHGCVTGSSYPANVGGGIYNDHSTLTVSNCDISYNQSFYGYGPGNNGGGGIYNDGDTSGSAVLTVINCFLSVNEAGNYGGDNGGGIYNDGANGGSATLTVVASTLYGNFGESGGGIYNDGYNGGSATLTVSVSTLYYNSAFDGAGIYNVASGSFSSAMLAVSASTLAYNNAFEFADSIYNDSGTLTLGDTILQAGDPDIGDTGTNIVNDGGTHFSYGDNLASDNGGGFLTNLGDQINTDPMLGDLAYNGGPTPTLMPLPGSPATDQGRPDTIPTLVRYTDQRGRIRPYDDPNVPNGPNSDGTDIGAVEVSPAHNIVGTTNDNGPSLRYCLADAQPGDTITFSNSVTGTIVLTQGELLVGQNVTIQGPGANVLGVSGNNASRVFNVSNGIVNISGLTIRDGKVAGAAGQLQDMIGGGIYCGQPATLALAGCVISNCAAVGANGLGTIYGNGGKAGNGYGGGIYNLGGLTLSNCWVVGNQAAGGQGGVGGHTTIPGVGGNGGNGMGGGIYSSSSQNVTIRSSTLSANLATYGAAGGGGLGSGTNGTATAAGLDISSGMVSLVNSTVASNGVNGAGSGVGGGIYASVGGLALLGCTIASNNSDNGGGGLASAGGSGVTNTIVALNTGGSSPDVSGTVSSGGYNLIGNTSGSTGFGATGDQLNVNPLLGPLQDNGGPTPTMALLLGSPAIDQGKSFGLTTDQRGEPRPFDWPSVPNATGGDASDIGAFERGRPRLSIQQAGNSAVLSWPSYYGIAEFSLQSSTNIASSNAWVLASGSPAVVGSQYQQTNSPISGSKLFRLRSN